MPLPRRVPQKIDLKPKKHHGFFFLIWFLGFLVPPLAVAVRFGIGTDFFINVILTICGYIPGHAHNFYIQNIRNNYNKKRTPKWARQLGLIDESEFERKKKKSQWAGRYNERNTESTMVGAPLAEGEEGDNYEPAPVLDEEEERRRVKGDLWRRGEEEYYGEQGQAENQRNWHYPANFEGADAATDRWDRTRAARDSPAPSKPRNKFLRNKSSKTDKRAQILAYAPNGNNGYNNSAAAGRSDPLDASYDGDVPEWGKDYGGRKKSRNRSGTMGSESTTGRDDRASGYDRGASYDRPASADRGGDYGYGGGEQPRSGNGGRTVEENWDHQF